MTLSGPVERGQLPGRTGHHASHAVSFMVTYRRFPAAEPGDRCLPWSHTVLGDPGEVPQNCWTGSPRTPSMEAMASITDIEFDHLLATFSREAIHLEMRDAYGTTIELPYLAKWEVGEPDDLQWLQDWCAMLWDGTGSGKTVRRVRVVSEPLSDYQRWSHSIAHPMVEAGEDIRWVPRRLVSSIAFPGNDFYLFDGRLVVFLHYAGNGLATEKVTSAAPADIHLCQVAFDAAWRLATPHGDYRPG